MKINQIQTTVSIQGVAENVKSWPAESLVDVDEVEPEGAGDHLSPK